MQRSLKSCGSRGETLLTTPVLSTGLLQCSENQKNGSRSSQKEHKSEHNLIQLSTMLGMRSKSSNVETPSSLSSLLKNKTSGQSFTEFHFKS